MSESLPRAEQLEQKRSFWKQHIDSWEKSGLTQAEYCRRLQLKAHQLAYWKRRFSQSDSQAEFVPIPLSPLMAPAEPCECKLHIVLSNGLKVEVTTGFDPQLLCQVVIALRGLP